MTLKSKPYWWVECDHDECPARCPDGEYEGITAWEDDDCAEQSAQDADWWVQPSAWGGAPRHWCDEHYHHCVAREDTDDDRRSGAGDDCPDCAPALAGGAS